LPSDVSPSGLESIDSYNSDSDYIPNISDEDDLETTTKRRRLYAGKRGLAASKRTWTTPERHAIKRVFSSNFEKQQPPSFHEVRLATIHCAELKARTIPQIRLWITNEINNLKNPMKRKSWATPVKRALKEAFGNYISDVHKGYPSSDIIQKKIREFNELRDKTPRKIRSQIQHQRAIFNNIHCSPAGMASATFPEDNIRFVVKFWWIDFDIHFLSSFPDTLT
ncbi:hypothetical protein JTB14_035744, partial [Gonioctena quinquepunctata]